MQKVPNAHPKRNLILQKWTRFSEKSSLCHVPAWVCMVKLAWSHGDILDSYRGVRKAWAYVGGYVGTMLGPCWAYVRPRTARSFCAWYQGQKERAIFWAMPGWGLWWAYIGPCWAFGATLGPRWGHVGAMLGRHFGAMLTLRSPKNGVLLLGHD